MRGVFLIIIIICAANAAHAQTIPDVCRVTGSVWSKSEKLGTGLYIYGEFHPVAFDETTDKSFANKESNLTIEAHVEFGDFNAAEKHKPIQIQLTLGVFDKRQKTNASADDEVTAKTAYGKHWGTLTVEKRVTIGNNVYTFGLTCDDVTMVRKRARFH